VGECVGRGCPTHHSVDLGSVESVGRAEGRDQWVELGYWGQGWWIGPLALFIASVRNYPEFVDLMSIAGVLNAVE